jgi:hypothetical protein
MRRAAIVRAHGFDVRSRELTYLTNLICQVIGWYPAFRRS